MSDNKVPNFILMFSSWREGNGPFAPHPVFPDGFAWVKDMKSKEWVMSGGKGLIITKTMWLKATNRGFTSIEDVQPGLHSESSTVVWPEGTPDGHIAVHDNINGDIYIVAPDHEFKTNEEPICVKQTGLKLDSGKPMMGCIPPHAELAVARVLTFGAQKYSRGNWAHVENSDERYMDAAMRHINAHRRGDNADSETGESHLAHAICCLMFMLESK